MQEMKGARFLIFPSELYENFPLTLCEAFACGVPVIASDIGAMKEIVQNGKTGLHFRAGDANDLAEKVEYAWTRREEMQQFGKQARVEFENKYTAEMNYRRLMEIYGSALSTEAKARTGFKNVLDPDAVCEQTAHA
jgi:glycosyltransferase involved in cell wall biosynthesis